MCLLRQAHFCRNERCLSQQTRVFVTTKLLSRQNYVLQQYLLQQNFCHNKIRLSQQKFCRYKHTKHDKHFVVTNIILVAAPRQWYEKHLTLMQAREPHKIVPPGKQLLGWLVKVTGLTLSCLRRGTGARRWGKREIIPNATYTVTTRMTPALSLVVEEGDYT